MKRRDLLLLAPVALLAPGHSVAATSEIWSAKDAADALVAGEITLIDVRSRDEWLETGVAEGAWPISMHEKGFQERFFAAREMSGGKPVALICATGGRSGSLLRALRRAGYTEFIDVSEGMLGSRRGPGWIKGGLPVVPLDAALQNLPEALR
ncbi:MAG: rhodanese-like domain-containing protein [Pseudomonadota bacterium]